MRFFYLFLLVVLVGGLFGNGIYKNGTHREVLDESLILAERNVLNITDSVYGDYSNINKTSLQRGCSLLSLSLTGFSSLILIESIKFGYINPWMDFQTLLILVFVYLILSTIMPVFSLKTVFKRR